MSSGRSMQAFCPSAVLVGLGKALGVSLDFLMGGQVEALKGIEFRKHSGTSAQDRAKAEAIVTEKLEDYLAIEDILDLAPPTDPFGDLVTDHVESFEAVDGIAYAHRHGTTYHELMRLKRLYGVSAAAMLMRLGQIGTLPHAAIEYAFRSYARAWRTAEPEPIRDDEGFGAFERPQRFERLVWRALGEELISPVRAAQLLRLPLATVEREIRGPRDR